MRGRGHPPSAAIVEAEQVHRQGRLCSQDNRSPSNDLVHVHAKTTLTVILPRFNPAPVGRIARLGLAPPSAAGNDNNHVPSRATATDLIDLRQRPERPRCSLEGGSFPFPGARGGKQRDMTSPRVCYEVHRPSSVASLQRTLIAGILRCKFQWGPPMSTENPVGPRATKDGSPATRQPLALSRSARLWRRFGFFLVFLVIAGLLALGTALLLPSDTPIYTPRTFGISDVVSSDPVEDIVATVTIRGDDHEIDITVVTQHLRSTRAGNTVGLLLHLPEGVTAQECHDYNCLNEGAGQGEVVLLQAMSSPLIPMGPAQSIGKPASQPSSTPWAADLFATVVGPGFAFNANGVTAEAELPSFDVTSTSLKSVTVDYGIPGATSYDWGGTPTPYFPLQNQVQWQESSSDAANSTLVNGVDHAAQSRENTYIFIAGILLGTAGSAVIAAFQELLHGGSEKPSSRRSRKSPTLGSRDSQEGSPPPLSTS